MSLSTFFGGATAPAKSVSTAKENLSSKFDSVDLSPEAVVTSPNFILVDNLFQGVIEVTPKMAENWLSRNKNIRQLMEPTYRLYAESMRNGKWDKNGESIKFDEDGNLIDGQHRCKAAVESGKSFVTSVVYGVESADNIDRNKVRKPDQIIAGKGIALNAKTMSAMISFLHAYNDEGSKGFVTVGHGKHPLTMEDRVAFAEANAFDLNHSIQVTDKVRKIFNKPSLHAALHYIFAKTAGVALADDFYEKLIAGTDLTATDPIYHLRERLRKEKDAKKQPAINEYAGMIIKGWNYAITCQQLSNFRYKFEVDGVPVVKRSPVLRTK